MKTKSILFPLLTIMIMMVCVTGLNISSAWSADLHQAKAAGQIGEKPNGYLGIVRNGAGIPALVQSINQRRRAVYQNIARKNGTTLQAVEQMAGQKAIAKTAAGQYIQSPSGAWIRK